MMPAKSAYEQFCEVTGGRDVTVPVQLSTLVPLIDRAMMPADARQRLIDSVIQKLHARKKTKP